MLTSHTPAFVRHLLVGALLTGFALARAATPVPTVAVGAGAATGGFEIDGSVQALRQATVAAQIGGNVVTLAVKAGDRVKAGQALARIDERDAAAGLARTDASVAQADAESRNAKLAVERTRDLRSKGFVSQAALDVAETQLKAAQAGLQAAQGARSQAALARGFAAVTAPFDGVVLATHLDAGDLASPGRAVATLYAPSAMRAVVQVPASRAEVARRATALQVRLPSGAWSRRCAAPNCRSPTRWHKPSNGGWTCPPAPGCSRARTWPCVLTAPPRPPLRASPWWCPPPRCCAVANWRPFTWPRANSLCCARCALGLRKGLPASRCWRV